VGIICDKKIISLVVYWFFVLLYKGRKMYKKNLTADETFGLAIQNQKKNNLQEAANFYKETIKTNPNHLVAHNNLGAVFKQLGELQKAINSCQKAIQINPNYADAHNNLGAVFYETGELQETIKCYQRVIQIEPNNVVAYTNLGVVFNELGDHEQAIDSCRRAIQINPNHSGAHNNLGEIYRRLKKFKEAANNFRKVGTDLANAQFLECTYLSNEMVNYNKLLNIFVEKDPINLRVAALAAYVSKKENIENIYPFCKNPLDYFFAINLKDKFKFSNEFCNRLLKISEKLGSNWRLKPIVKKGHQSTGNLLDNPDLEIVELKKRFENQISIYREKYKDSNDYYISRWPSKSKLNGWYIKLKKQGEVKSHMHESGWLSAVFYLKIPKTLKKNEGSIHLTLQGLDYPYDKSLPNFCYAPKPFDLILYPSSLFHYTVPFNSNEERHCIAFDVTP